jgi:hypothetical protein
MVRTWAMECERAGITVNAVIPVAATAMTATMPAFAPYVTSWHDDGTPLPSWLRAGEGFGPAEDVAGLVVFLASRASDGVTGQAIGIGGDRLALWTPGGWSPKYFPPQLVRYANTLLKDKVLFGTDFPLITPDRWLADFDALDIRPDVRPRILKDNAVRLLGLREGHA